MLEVRLLDKNRELKPTVNETRAPEASDGMRGDTDMLLVDTRVDGKVRPVRPLSTDSVAVVMHNKRGRVEGVWNRGERIGNEEEERRIIHHLMKNNAPMTCFDIGDGRTVSIFLLPKGRSY